MEDASKRQEGQRQPSERAVRLRAIVETFRHVPRLCSRAVRRTLSKAARAKGRR